MRVMITPTRSITITNAQTPTLTGEPIVAASQLAEPLSDDVPLAQSVHVVAPSLLYFPEKHVLPQLIHNRRRRCSLTHPHTPNLFLSVLRKDILPERGRGELVDVQTRGIPKLA